MFLMCLPAAGGYQPDHDHGASVGITEAEKGMGFRNLYERADRALYKAKEQGRDGYYIAE